MKTDRDRLDALSREWRDGADLVLRADDHDGDHPKIREWVARFLEQGPRDEDDRLLLSLIHHSLNFDIPFDATANVRAEMLGQVRARLRAGDSS